MVPGLSLEHIVILGIIALVVVGPKDLPLLLRKLGQWTARLRGMAQEFRTGFDELARQAELDELKREVQSLRQTTSLASLGNEMSKPLGTLESYSGLSPPPPPPAQDDAPPAATENVEAPSAEIKQPADAPAPVAQSAP
ncbi:MAG: Sec-independent protein translocase protein TatB [Vitreimonas sp.]